MKRFRMMTLRSKQREIVFFFFFKTQIVMSCFLRVGLTWHEMHRRVKLPEKALRAAAAAEGAEVRIVEHLTWRNVVAHTHWEGNGIEVISANPIIVINIFFKKRKRWKDENGKSLSLLFIRADRLRIRSNCRFFPYFVAGMCWAS